MNKKPVVLAFNKHYLPGYRASGLIRPLSNMVDRLGKDIDFHIVTLDRDAGSKEPYSDIEVGDWTTVGDAKVFYLNPQRLAVKPFVELFNEIEPDVIYLNSFFDNVLTHRVLWARRLEQLGRVPIILAPRGELSSSELDIKWLKKKIFLRFARAMKLYSGLVWHAASEQEKEDILNALDFVSNKEVLVANNLAPAKEQPAIAHKSRSSAEPLRVCFLSRIYPIKNLDFALKVLAQVKSPVIFTIYGPKEVESYWKECESLIASLPSNITVKDEGEINPLTVKQKLIQHDLFFLPSQGENFGYAIQEALAAGLPVLISDQTPWSVVHNNGIGWVYPLTSIDPFVRTIEEVSNWPAEQQEVIAQRAQLFVNERINDSDAVDDNLALFTRFFADKGV